MSKKKSYMDRKNILSEGFVKTFLSFFIPIHGMKLLLKNRRMKKLEKDITKHEKNLKNIKQKSNKLFDEFMDELNKETNQNIKKQDAKRMFDTHFGKK